MPAMALSSCDNQDIEFPDYEDGVSVYFAYQTPVRTIVLGTDEYDTTLDKQHKCVIKSTMGGSYKGKSLKVDVRVAPEICDNVYFDETFTSPVQVMPESYYSLSGSQLDYKGSYTGDIEVQLTDAFFADPKSVENTYVIPLVMTGVRGNAKISSGTPVEDGAQPAFANAEAWKVLPKNYIMYAVKYKSKYDAGFVRCGNYALDSNQAVQLPADSTAKWVGHFDPVTDGIVCSTKTKSLNSVSYTVEHNVPYTVNEGGKQVVKYELFKCDMLLTFDDSNNCTVSSLTEGVTISGNGVYTPNGAKKAWGDKDRDLISLSYTIETAAHKLTCTENLVWTNSGVAKEEFTANYKL